MLKKSFWAGFFSVISSPVTCIALNAAFVGVGLMIDHKIWIPNALLLAGWIGLFAYLNRHKFRPIIRLLRADRWTVATFSDDASFESSKMRIGDAITLSNHYRREAETAMQQERALSAVKSILNDTTGRP